MTSIPSSGSTTLPPRAPLLRGARASALHWLVICAGAALLATNAFHANLWYDETYSVALVTHPLDQIWDIGSDDVHPVLYYLALHILYIVFGQNIVAYRLFSLCGMAVLSLLGWTHLRRDIGPIAAIVYSALVYALPWSIRIAFQIRMYSWATVAVMLVVIYAWRIILIVLENARSGSTSGATVPPALWAALFAASIASAYLHYYAAAAAFVVQAILIVVCIRSAAGKRVLIAWAVGAVIAVACYLPWISAVMSQISVVGGGEYWIQFQLMGSVSEFTLFPLNPPEMEHVSTYGFYHVALGLAVLVGTVCAGAWSLYGYGVARGMEKRPAEGGNAASEMPPSPFTFGIAVTVGTALVMFAASLALGHAALYFRYLVVCMGPLAVAMAIVITRTADKRAGIATLCLVIACGALTFASLYDTSHADDNAKTLEEYQQACDTAEQLGGAAGALSISPDVYTASILATADVGMPITYIPQWENAAYRAYEPRFVLGQTMDQALDGFSGCVVFVGPTEDAQKLVDGYGGRIVSHDYYFHSYSSRWFDYTVIDFAQAGDR